PKCPRSWLPRVKLRRLCFIASLPRKAAAGELAGVGLVRALPQLSVRVARKQRIEGDGNEQILPRRIERGALAFRRVLALPDLDEMIADDDADGDVLVSRLLLHPVRD